MLLKKYKFNAGKCGFYGQSSLLHKKINNLWKVNCLCILISNGILNIYFSNHLNLKICAWKNIKHFSTC